MIACLHGTMVLQSPRMQPGGETTVALRTTARRDGLPVLGQKRLGVYSSSTGKSNGNNDSKGKMNDNRFGVTVIIIGLA